MAGAEVASSYSIRGTGLDGTVQVGRNGADFDVRIDLASDQDLDVRLQFDPGKYTLASYVTEVPPRDYQIESRGLVHLIHTGERAYRLRFTGPESPDDHVQLTVSRNSEVVFQQDLGGS